MSIDAELDKLTPDILTFLSPVSPGITVVRDIFVSKEVLDIVGDEATPPDAIARVAGKARAKLDLITRGNMFVLGMDPKPGRKSPTCLIARTSPLTSRILDLRVSDPNPGVRIFGGLAKRNVFVALTWAPRENCDFSVEVARCRSEWNKLFPDHPPFYSTDYKEYFSDVLPG